MDHDKAFNAALDRLAAEMNEPAVKEWVAARKKAGQELDPETADVTCSWAQTADPYGLCTEFPEELDCVGKELFARAEGSDIWISFDHLPEATIERLRQRIKAGDFDRTDVLAPLTLDQVRAEVQLGLYRQIETAALEIEECNQLDDGRFQLIIREHHGGWV